MPTGICGIKYIGWERFQRDLKASHSHFKERREVERKDISGAKGVWSFRRILPALSVVFKGLRKEEER